MCAWLGHYAWQEQTERGHTLSNDEKKSAIFAILYNHIVFSACVPGTEQNREGHPVDNYAKQSAIFGKIKLESNWSSVEWDEIIAYRSRERPPEAHCLAR